MQQLQKENYATRTLEMEEEVKSLIESWVDGGIKLPYARTYLQQCINEVDKLLAERQKGANHV